MELSGIGALGSFLFLGFVVPGFCYLFVFAVCFPDKLGTLKSLSLSQEEKDKGGSFLSVPLILILAIVVGLLLSSVCFATEAVLRWISLALSCLLSVPNIFDIFFPPAPIAKIAIIEAAGKGSFYAHMISGSAIMHFNVGLGILLMLLAYGWIRYREETGLRRRVIIPIGLALVLANFIAAHETFKRAKKAIEWAVDSIAADERTPAAGQSALGFPGISGLPNLTLVVEKLISYHDCTCACGCYERDLEHVGNRALGFLKQYLTSPHTKDTKPAIVIDIDDTALSNWENMRRMGFAYDPNEFLVWEREAKAPAIKPVLELFQYAHDQGVATMFLTGRSEAEREVTVKDLEAAGYKDWTSLIMRKNDSPRFAVDFKSAERKTLKQAGYIVVVNIGDQDSDLAGEPALGSFKLPNPFYYLR
jgi:acid phosphatase